MPAKYSKKKDGTGRSVVLEFNHDVHRDIVGFYSTFRSFLYQSLDDKNCHKVRSLKNENFVVREFLSMKTGIRHKGIVNINEAVKLIKEIVGTNEDGSVVCPETQMERCCEFIAEKTGKEIVGYCYHEPHARPKFVTSAHVGDFNLILVKKKNGKYATANTHNMFPKDGKLFCISCRKHYKQTSEHTSECRIRCRHCFGLGRNFPCQQELPDGEWLKCDSCFFEFKSQKCFDQHKVTACHKKIKCQKCGQAASTVPGNHICGSSHCFKCHLIHPPNDPQNGANFCFIKKQRINLAMDFQRALYVIYDIETRPVYVTEKPKKRTFIPDPNDSDDDMDIDLEEADGFGCFMSTIGDHNDDILPDDNGVDGFISASKRPEEEVDDFGIVDYEELGDEEQENFNDDLMAAQNMKSNWKHVANLLCAKIRCSDCFEIVSDDYSCEFCDHTTLAWTTVPNMPPVPPIEDSNKATENENVPNTATESENVPNTAAESENNPNTATESENDPNTATESENDPNTITESENDSNTETHQGRIKLPIDVIPEEVEDVCGGFRDYLIQQSEKPTTSSIYCYAHNGARFDSHFAVSSFVEEGYNPSNLLSKGNTMISATFSGGEIDQKLHFRDSFRLLPVPLKSFQKTFELDPKVCKFDFPHYYNREEFYDVELDSLPHPEYYGVSNMKKTDAKAFMEKYDKENQEMQEKGEKYRLPEQLLKYCLQDVECLYRGILSHREQLKPITQEIIDSIDFEKNAKKLGKNSDPKYFDLFLKGSTVASLALYIYRLKFMSAETVALVPETGYQSNVNQSKIAIAYMDYIMEQNKPRCFIQHRDNIGEHKIGGELYVDGLDMETGDVYQIMGCQFHGCVKCLQADRSKIQWNGKSANDLYSETVRKQKQVRAAMAKHPHRYRNLIEVWECDIEEERKTNDALDKYIKNHVDSSPINLRKSLCGGRTGPMVLEAEADENTEIKYFDICSLYPYINFTTKYPTKHPEIKFGVPAYQTYQDVPELTITKCLILPPKNLKLPIIPMKFEGQLLFPLCGKCPKERTGVDKETGMNKNEIRRSCTHSEQDRAFVTSSTSMELRYAILNGYEVLKIFHVLEWHEGTEHLFKDYVREFLKMKVEASEPPPGYNDDPKVREEFQELYRDVYGIEIGDCKFNAGRRFISKLFLNSLWGKFSMGVYEEKVVVDNGELYKYISDPTLYDLTYHRITDSSIMVRFKRDENYTVAPNVNLVISLWTTAAAKLHLYKFMKAIELYPGAICLYCDTDSIIFMHLKGKCPLVPGQLLGEMTDEYPSKIITHYRSGGAKQYFLKYKDRVTGEEGECCKNRGFVANEESERLITYDTMEFNSKKSVTLKNTTLGPHHDFGVYQTNSTKVYRTTCQKGIIADNHVLPFGWSFEHDAIMGDWHPDVDDFTIKKNLFANIFSNRNIFTYRRRH